MSPGSVGLTLPLVCHHPATRAFITVHRDTPAPMTSVTSVITGDHILVTEGDPSLTAITVCITGWWCNTPTCPHRWLNWQQVLDQKFRVFIIAIVTSNWLRHVQTRNPGDAPAKLAARSADSCPSAQACRKDRAADQNSAAAISHIFAIFRSLV